MNKRLSDRPGTDRIGAPSIGRTYAVWPTFGFMTAIWMALALYTILRCGGLGNGGFNFDAHLRRQSLDREDLFHAHVGGIDVLARGLLAAAAMIEGGELEAFVEQRYAGWSSALGREILDGKHSLADLARFVVENEIEPQPRSGRQEWLENLVNRYV